jgi:hypothetical protein
MCCCLKSPSRHLQKLSGSSWTTKSPSSRDKSDPMAACPTESQWHLDGCFKRGCCLQQACSVERCTCCRGGKGWLIVMSKQPIGSHALACAIVAAVAAAIMRVLLTSCIEPECVEPECARQGKENMELCNTGGASRKHTCMRDATQGGV